MSQTITIYETRAKDRIVQFFTFDLVEKKL
jgi:hypothetical protein